MHGRLSLQSRLTACFLAFSVLPLLLFFLIFFPYLQGSMLKSRMAALEALAGASTGDLINMGDSILREGERLAQDPRVQTVLTAPKGKADDAALAQLTSYLRSMTGEDCRGAVLVKAGWQVAAASDEAAYTGEALALLLGTETSFSGEREVTGLLPSLALPGGQAIYFSVPILRGGSLLGVLIREMPLVVVSRMTASLIQGETGRMMLVDAGGIILAHTDAGLIGTRLEQGRLLDAFQSFQSGLNERSGNGSARLFGKQQGYGYCILGGMPWMFVVYQAESELRSQEVLAVLFAVLATLGLSLLSFFISRIVSRSLVFPLKRLNVAFRQAGRNQFVPLAPGGTSEMAELAEGYNAMIGLVEKNITRLSDSNRHLAMTIAELEVEQDRLQFPSDTSCGGKTRWAKVEFNLLSGDFLADDGFYAMLHLNRSVTKLPLAELLRSMADPEDTAALLESIAQQADQVHRLVRLATGEGAVFVQVHARVYYNTQGDPTKVSATLLDATDDHMPPAAEAALDSVTGLSTRIPFEKTLETYLGAGKNLQEGGMLACISLQGLPDRDDQRMAHVLALRITADRLRSFAGLDGMAARLDESRFLLHLPRCASVSRAESALAELSQVLSAPIPCQRGALTVKMLAGATLYPGNETRPQALLSQAQAAMASAAFTEGAAWLLYNPSSQTEDADTLRLAMEKKQRVAHITQALSTFQPDGSLSLEYQPIISLADSSVAGFECTVRLKVASLGMVSAGELIPLAEKNGHMLPVGRFVLKEACRMIKKLRRQREQDLFVSVNISAQQLMQPDFADTVYIALKDAGLPGSALQLEISERIMDTFTAQADKLHVLRRMGVRVALDDYGAGSGALTHLYNMPLDVLKVDKSFLTGASESQGKEFILKTVVDLAHSLNLKVAAVGVEHFRRLNTLMKLDYDMAQGYHFCPPLAADDLEVYLDTRPPEGGV